jgi:hypothetical protein
MAEARKVVTILVADIVGFRRFIGKSLLIGGMTGSSNGAHIHSESLRPATRRPRI